MSSSTSMSIFFHGSGVNVTPLSLSDDGTTVTIALAVLTVSPECISIGFIHSIRSLLGEELPLLLSRVGSAAYVLAPPNSVCQTVLVCRFFLLFNINPTITATMRLITHNKKIPPTIAIRRYGKLLLSLGVSIVTCIIVLLGTVTVGLFCESGPVGVGLVIVFVDGAVVPTTV